MSNLTYEQFEEELAKIPYARPKENRAKWQTWQSKRVELSQRVKVYEIAGESYERESYNPDYEVESCHDCGVKRGMFHIPGCDMERCPKCRGQSISCDCDGLEDDEERGKS